jgi:hypothetical protein
MDDEQVTVCGDVAAVRRKIGPGSWTWTLEPLSDAPLPWPDVLPGEPA